MLDEIPKCEKGWQGKHDWMRLGVASEDGKYFQIWRCNHCNKCATEELQFFEQ